MAVKLKEKVIKDPRQKIMWIFLPLVLVLGFLYPPAGLVVILCMLGAVGISLFKGRVWCHWMCPRGSFFDYILARFSPNRKVPAFIKKDWFRVAVLILIMGMMLFSVLSRWGDLYAMGRVFTMMLFVTTLIGIVLGLITDSRIWCQVCPMGTLAGWLGRYNKPVVLCNDCSRCGICEKICPMQVDLLKWKDLNAGIIGDTGCIRCSLCTRACPKGAVEIMDVKKIRKEQKPSLYPSK
ncbi:MAG: 4Fe-4S binding protein [Clostridia bacterium]|nr:4Fe-4S binding protein [Clostridia bacterium]